MSEVGLASWYGNESGNRTANGERFDPHGHTAAHRRHRFGTRLRVENLRNGKTVIVRVNDRGPAKWTGRIIDLARGAAEQIGMIHSGVAKVRVTVIP